MGWKQSGEPHHDLAWLFLGCLLATPASCDGTAGPMGAKGEPGAAGTVEPTLNFLYPTAVYAGRQLQLQVAGTGTHFDSTTVAEWSAPTLRVTKVEVGSSANLRLYVDVAADAPLAAHDLTVTTPRPGGDERLVLTGGLTVQPSLSSDPTGNTRSVVQGGLADFALTNLDTAAPLASTPQVNTGGLLLSVSAATASQFSGTLLVDTLAAPGPLSLIISTRDTQGRTASYVVDPKDPDAPQISARAPTPLTIGTPEKTEALQQERVTNLYQITSPSDDQVALLLFNNLGSRLQMTGLRGAIAPASGRFNEGHLIFPTQSILPTNAAAVSYLPKAGNSYLSVGSRDASGAASGFGYEMLVRLAPAKKIGSLKEPVTPDAPARPLQDINLLDGPYVGTDGAIDTPGDNDYVRFKVAGPGRVLVQAAGSGALQVPSVTLYQSNCTTQVAAARQVSQELNAATGTQYCARISGPAQLYSLIISPDF